MIRCGAALAALLLLAPPSFAAEPYVIHDIASLTGQGAFLGQGERAALDLVEKAINDARGIRGRPLHFTVVDDASNPQTAVQLATDIIAEKPTVFFGPGLAATCRAVAPLLENGPVMYCFSPLLVPAPKSYAFTLELAASSVNRAQIRFDRLKGWRRLAFLYTTDASGQANEAAINQILALPENAEMKAVAVEHFGIGDVSVAAQLEAIKSAHPDAMLMLVTGTPVATVYRGLVQAGLDIPVATGGGSMTYAQMAQYKDFLPPQLYITTSQWVARDPSLVSPGVAAQIARFYRYFEAAGIRPDLPSTHSWSVGMLVAGALEKIGLDATPTQLRDYLESLDDVPGIYGDYDFVHKDANRGLDASDAMVTRWSKEKDTWIPASRPGGTPLP